METNTRTEQLNRLIRILFPFLRRELHSQVGVRSSIHPQHNIRFTIQKLRHGCLDLASLQRAKRGGDRPPRALILPSNAPRPERRILDQLTAFLASESFPFARGISLGRCLLWR
jgi:hypothetical protein